MEASQTVIEVDPEKMHGTPVFRGTRVPIESLFDWLAGGDSVDYFLENFPTVERSQITELFELIKESLLIEQEVAV